MFNKKKKEAGWFGLKILSFVFGYTIGVLLRPWFYDENDDNSPDCGYDS